MHICRNTHKKGNELPCDFPGLYYGFCDAYPESATKCSKVELARWGWCIGVFLEEKEVQSKTRWYGMTLSSGRCRSQGVAHDILHQRWSGYSGTWLNSINK